MQYLLSSLYDLLICSPEILIIKQRLRSSSSRGIFIDGHCKLFARRLEWGGRSARGACRCRGRCWRWWLGDGEAVCGWDAAEMGRGDGTRPAVALHYGQLRLDHPWPPELCHDLCGPRSCVAMCQSCTPPIRVYYNRQELYFSLIHVPFGPHSVSLMYISRSSKIVSGPCYSVTLFNRTLYSNDPGQVQI